jgi:hypothetical protein
MIFSRRPPKKNTKPIEEPIVEVELDAETYNWHAFVHPLDLLE